MNRLSPAAVGDVHVVLSDRPEALRAALGMRPLRGLTLLRWSDVACLNH